MIMEQIIELVAAGSLIVFALIALLLVQGAPAKSKDKQNKEEQKDD